jgi:predicted enzyme related to lactoylglutathione lyase
VTVALHNLTFDCADARGLAAFWAELLGWSVFHDDDPEVLVAPAYPSTGLGLLFIPVPEGKTAKNRLHLDLSPTDCTRDEQVEKALALGASVHEDHRGEDGRGWVTMKDPEGNEFCVERGHVERGPQRGTYRLG